MKATATLTGHMLQTAVNEYMESRGHEVIAGAPVTLSVDDVNVDLGTDLGVRVCVSILLEDEKK